MCRTLGSVNLPTRHRYLHYLQGKLSLVSYISAVCCLMPAACCLLSDSCVVCSVTARRMGRLWLPADLTQLSVCCQLTGNTNWQPSGSGDKTHFLRKTEYLRLPPACCGLLV